MKCFILIFLFIIFCSCETYKHSYSEKRGLMLLKTQEQPRNKKFNENKYRNNIKKSYRKYHK